MMEKRKISPKNQVLADTARTSENFFHSDGMLRHYLRTHLSEAGFQFMEKNLWELGEKAAGEMNPLSLLADRNGPELIKRNPYGETLNEIRFHPAYWELVKIAVESGMLRVKWEPMLRKQFIGENHSMGFSAFYLFAMSELGLDCPLCMTDGVALLLDRFAPKEVKNRLLPTIYTENPKAFRTGGMFLTEKSGGSDVGSNLVTATHDVDETYHLNGEKWFCSNANGEIIFALARTDPEVLGTRGLSIFLVEKYLEDGSRNPLDIVRLKEKLGVRSMASAECVFTDTVGKRIGEEFEGFRIMAEMVNLSRIHNALASVAGGRRALIEAYQFLSFRNTFGKNALDHALVRHKLHELGAKQVGSFYLLWRAIRAFDKALTGDEAEIELLRQLTPC